MVGMVDLDVTIAISLELTTESLVLRAFATLTSALIALCVHLDMYYVKRRT